MKMRNNSKQGLKLIIGIIISVLFLYLAFKKINLSALVSSLCSVRISLVLIATLANLGSYFIIGWRWQWILKPLKSVKYSLVYHSTTVGFMSNSLLPARIGELIKTFLLGEVSGIAKSSVLATVVIERMFDIIILVFFFIIVNFLFPLPLILKKAGLIVGLVIFILFFLLFLIRFKPDFFYPFLKRFPEKYSSRFINWFDAFKRGISIPHGWKGFLVIFLQTVLIRGYLAAVLYLLFFAFGFHLPFYAALVLLVAVSFGVMIPSSPSFVGTYHFFSSEVLSLFNVSREVALSYSVVAHFISFIPVILLGLFSLLWLRISFHRILSFSRGIYVNDK